MAADLLHDVRFAISGLIADATPVHPVGRADAGQVHECGRRRDAAAEQRRQQQTAEAQRLAEQEAKRLAEKQAIDQFFRRNCGCCTIDHLRQRCRPSSAPSSSKLGCSSDSWRRDARKKEKGREPAFPEITLFLLKAYFKQEAEEKGEYEKEK